jgi:hypothetical protein
LEKVTIAYYELSHRGRRWAYDLLDEDTLWLQGDRFAQEREAQRADQRLQDAAESPEELRDLREQLQQKIAEAISTDPEQAPIKEEKPPSTPARSADWIYYVRGDVVPEDLTGWLQAVALAWWRLGRVEEVKVGFHDGPFGCSDESWGRIMWVPDHATPSAFMAMCMVWEVAR